MILRIQMGSRTLPECDTLQKQKSKKQKSTLLWGTLYNKTKNNIFKLQGAKLNIFFELQIYIQLIPKILAILQIQNQNFKKG